MSNISYPARIVFHEDPRGSHFDLFLRLPDASHLATYELMVAAAPPEGFVLTACAPEDPGAMKAVRKPDHRARYWEYSGPIPERGRIDSRSYGRLHGSFLPDVLYVRS